MPIQSIGLEFGDYRLICVRCRTRVFYHQLIRYDSISIAKTSPSSVGMNGANA